MPTESAERLFDVSLATGKLAVADRRLDLSLVLGLAKADVDRGGGAIVQRCDSAVRVDCDWCVELVRNRDCANLYGVVMFTYIKIQTSITHHLNHHSHITQTHHGNTSFKHAIQAHHSDTSFTHIIQTHHTNTSCKHIMQRNTSCKHIIQTHHSGTSFRHIIQTHHSNTSFKHITQTKHANTSFRHIIQTYQ